MKRLMIYFFYDKDGIVDNYIYYFLNAFKSYCEEICVVVNGILEKKAQEKLKQNVNHLLIRENVGYDSCAYKHAIEFYGYDKLKEYDEVILANFTMFGPIFSPKTMFLEMENRDCDFWGITKHPANKSRVAGIKIEEHVQSYFIAYRKNILNSDDFKTYWQTLKTPTNYEEAVAFHELRGTQYFESKGYKSDAFINPDKYRIPLKEKPYFYFIHRQIIEDSMLFVKRKIFNIKHSKLEYPIEASMQSLFKTINKETNYPIDLMIENLQRTLPVTENDNLSMLYEYIYLTIKRWTSLQKAKKYIKLRNSIKDVRYLLNLIKGKR